MPGDSFYKSKAWKTVRTAVIARDGGRCAVCGQVQKGWHFVDHIRSRHRAPHLALDPANLQTMCRRCHTAKTNAREGGYGNRPHGRPTSGGVGADGVPRNPQHPWAKMM